MTTGSTDQIEEYETIIRALTDAVYVLDEEGRFSYVSDELVELVGYDRETVLGSAPSLIKDEAAVERAERELGRLLSSDGPETVTFEVTLQPRDGDPIVCEDQMGVLPYDGDEFDGSVGTLRDITDRKERKQELQTIKRQYQTLVENFPDGAVFLFDSDLRYVRAGGTELSETGVSGDEVEGATPHDLFPEELADETARYYRETLAGNSHTYEQEYRDERYRIQTVPVRTDGEVAYGLAVSQKVTEQVEHRRALERQNERLDEFASVVSHDLRNPLNTADLGLELAQSDCESAHLEDARKGVQRSLDLIEDLLSLAREGEQGIEARPVGLEDAVRNAWASLDTAEATLSLETDLVIRADRDRLRQLLINLVENAVDHGGADVAIAVGEMDDGFYLEDDGPGIPEKERENVFEAGHTTSEEGTGIGLRIVRQVADSHGWTVTVTDGTDDGARFEIAGVETAD